MSENDYLIFFGYVLNLSTLRYFNTINLHNTYYLGNFAHEFKHLRIMNKQLLFDFNAFRKWFNKMFSLSLDGKFKGLCSLALVMDFDRFAYRLYKILSGYYRKPASDVICIRLSGHVVKLYNR